MESLEKTVRLFFPPFPQNLEIDVADFHITTAMTTRGEGGEKHVLTTIGNYGCR